MQWMDIRKIVVAEVRFLLFRPVRMDMPRLKWAYATFGVGTAWLVGIGRYWDNPRAEIWQHLGLGSIVYVFALSMLLWIIVLPLRPRNWSYTNVLIFVGMTALPGLLYAIPVERFTSMAAAGIVNMWFLAIVALWRVGLLMYFLRQVARLSAGEVFLATFLPMTAIVWSLTVLNLEHVVFRVMAGVSEHETSVNDLAYLVVIFLTFISTYLLPVLIISFIIIVFLKRRRTSENEKVHEV